MILELILALSTAHATACWKTSGQYELAGADLSYQKISDPQNKLDIYVPNNSLPPFRTVISIHGGCFEWGDKRSDEDMNQIRRFTNAGYAVVSVNYRLADPKQKKNLFPASLEDVQDAVRWVRSHGATYELKTDQLVAFGYSAGATLAAYLGTRGERVAGVIDLFGRTDFEHAFANEKKYDGNRDCAEEYLGVNRAVLTEKQFAMASVLEAVDRKAAKFLIVHGNKDEDVSIEHSRLLYAKLMSVVPERKRPQFYTIDGAAHMFSKPGEMDQAWEKICPFLTDVLGAPTPAHTAANAK